MQPAMLDLSYTIPAATTNTFIDSARSLSRTNRRLYSQTRNYAFQGLTFIWRAGANVASIELKVKTAGNTWVVQNAHTKGEALWHEMNDLVLDDNPSIEGKWADYKVTLSDQHTPALTLDVRDGVGVAVDAGEWLVSKYVMPQHDIDLATGLPLPADEFTAHIIGPDTLSKRGLVKAYQESRATVSPDQPNVPGGMSTSFFNLLTDSGSQEPELADEIEFANDNPPYAIDDYPGGDANADTPWVVGYASVSAAEVDGRIGGFIAPCGLIELETKAFGSDGLEVAAPAIDIILHVAPGMYKGTASVPMGQ